MRPPPAARAYSLPVTSPITCIDKPSLRRAPAAWRRSMPIATLSGLTGPRRGPVQTKVLSRIDDVAASEWNALAGDYPFMRHEFLAALENTGCANARTGWRPRHVVLRDATGLTAAAPLYEKTHSWGEFVFDFSWARAAEQAGMHYYPKLVCAIPFTPTTGPRLLCRADPQASSLREQLLRELRAQASTSHCSSVHALFMDAPARSACEQQQWLLRRD